MSTKQQSSQRSGRNGRVLVLGTDQRVILAVARSLGRHGLEVHLGWCPAESIAAHSRYVHQVHSLPAYSPHDGRWKGELLRLLDRESYDLVIPCNDSALVPLMAHRADFSAHPEIHLLDDPVFALVSDKFRTYELAVSVGVTVPRGRVVDGSADPHQLVEEFGLPLVLKPQATFTVHSEGASHVVRKARSVAELAEILPTLGHRPILVQENFVGRGAGIEMLVRDGEILFAFQHRRLHETMEWGSSYRESVPIRPDLLEAARRLMRATGYTGVAMAEFILAEHSPRWVFLEINGRFWGSLPLAIAAGADFPYYLYQMVVEQRESFADDYRRHVRCRNLTLDLGWCKQRSGNGWRKALLPFRLLAELAAAGWHHDHWDNFSWDDPWPQWVELAEWGRKLRRWPKSLSAPSPVSEREASQATSSRRMPDSAASPALPATAGARDDGVRAATFPTGLHLPGVDGHSSSPESLV